MKEQDREEQKPEMKAQVSLTSNDEHAIQLELLSALQKGGGHRLLVCYNLEYKAMWCN